MKTVIGIHSKKNEVVLDKAIYVDFSILELSKVHMSQMLPFNDNEILSDKVRDHCHLTGKHRGPTHSKCNFNVTQVKSDIILFAFHNFSNYDCQIFFKKVVDIKNDKVKFKYIPNTKEDFNSVVDGCTIFIDSYRFISGSLDKSVKNLIEDDFVILKKEFPDEWQYLNKKLAKQNQNFNTFEDYQKPAINLGREDFFSELNNKCPEDDEIARTIEIIEIFDIKNGEELTKFFWKSDVYFR